MPIMKLFRKSSVGDIPTNIPPNPGELPPLPPDLNFDENDLPPPPPGVTPPKAGIPPQPPGRAIYQDSEEEVTSPAQDEDMGRPMYTDDLDMPPPPLREGESPKMEPPTMPPEKMIKKEISRRFEGVPSSIPPLEENILPPEPSFEEETPKNESLIDIKVRKGESIFVRVDEFRENLLNIEGIQEGLKGFEEIVMGLNRINNEKEIKLEELRKALEEIEKKLIFMDKSLFEEVA